MRTHIHNRNGQVVGVVNRSVETAAEHRHHLSAAGVVIAGAAGIVLTLAAAREIAQHNLKLGTKRQTRQ
jgi:hypothetical protein